METNQDPEIPTASNPRIPDYYNPRNLIPGLSDPLLTWLLQLDDALAAEDAHPGSGRQAVGAAARHGHLRPLSGLAGLARAAVRAPVPAVTVVVALIDESRTMLAASLCKVSRLLDGLALVTTELLVLVYLN